MYRLLPPILLLTFALLSCSPPLRKQHLLVIGDSNGASQGWAYQLQELRGGGPMVNTAISGNTIAFNGDGQLRLNTLENLTAYLRRGYAEMGQVDEIIISLGTNDCKTEFSELHDQLGQNMTTLLNRIEAFFADRGQETPRIVLVTPPPVAEDEKLIDKFRGARGCVASFSEELRQLADERGLCLVDWQRKPGDDLLQYSRDGIHFDARGYEQLAEAVAAQCY